MSATHGEGVYGNAAGVTTPLDHKMAQVTEFVKTAANTVRSGVLWDGNTTLVSGKANMSYDVRAMSVVLTRGATAGVVKLANDAVYNVATTAAPGSNSRYDVVYIWQREYSLDGTDSNPVIGVVQGTAAASPTVPSLASFPGALELARILVPSGVTATNSGATITQTGVFTATAGGVLPFRNSTERDAGSYVESQLGWLLDTDVLQKYNGSAWFNLSNRDRIIPTITSTGGSAAVDTATGEVTASGAITQLNVTIPNATRYKCFEVTYVFRGSTSGTYTVKLLNAGTPEATASAHRYKQLADASSTAIGTGTSWTFSAGSRTEHFRRVVVEHLAQAKYTVWDERGGSSDASAFDTTIHNYARHIVATALDGFRFDLSGMGTLADVSVIIEGLN